MSKLSYNNILNKLLIIISNNLDDIDVNYIKQEDTFNDLNINEFQRIVIFIDIEKEFDIDIEDNMLIKSLSIDDLVNYIIQIIQTKQTK